MAKQLSSVSSAPRYHSPGQDNLRPRYSPGQDNQVKPVKPVKADKAKASLKDKVAPAKPALAF